jgi:hypothetical protein
VPAPYFPLRDGMTWIYSVTGPVIQRIFKAWIEPQVDIEIEDLGTRAVRSARAWVLREEDAPKLTYAVESEHGVQFLRERHLDKPDRKAIVVTSDLRWGGAPTWTRPTYHYTLGTERCRREPEEEEVTVTAGRFRCLKILLDDGETGAVWLARDVGIVREVSVIDGLESLRYSVLELHTAPADIRPRAR